MKKTGIICAAAIFLLSGCESNPDNKKESSLNPVVAAVTGIPAASENNAEDELPLMNEKNQESKAEKQTSTTDSRKNECSTDIHNAIDLPVVPVGEP